MAHLNAQLPSYPPRTDSAFIAITSLNGSVRLGETWSADIFACHYITNDSLTMQVNGRTIKVINGVGRDTLWSLPKRRVFEVEIMKENKRFCMKQQYRNTFEYPSVCQ